MTVTTPQTFLLATCAVAAVAAAFDWRTKRIPNVVTFGGLLLAFPLHAWVSPTIVGLESASLGMIACAVPSLVGWRLGWVAGGDVKLIAAMGALGGISFGLEAVFLSLFTAVSFIFLRLCWNGLLLRTVGNGLAFTASRTVLRRLAVAPAAEFTSQLRFGPFALSGAALALCIHGAIV